MLGWEFPPVVSGGLGVACYGLSKALNGMGTDVLFLLPKPLAKNGNGNGHHHEPHGMAALSHQTRHVPAVTRLPQSKLAQAVHAAQRPVEKVVPIHEEHEETFQRVTFVPVDVLLEPYMTPAQYQRMVVEDVTGKKLRTRWEKFTEHQSISDPGHTAAHHEPDAVAENRSFIEEPTPSKKLPGNVGGRYAEDLFLETERYARLALSIAQSETFDVVHAHDWMTFEAATMVAGVSHKPLIVQIHSTEVDRAGENANPRIVEIEKRGMLAAKRVIAVSHRSRNQLIELYKIPAKKIEVVYNGGSTQTTAASDRPFIPTSEPLHKTVLFLGRLTQQKGPDYFLRAAKLVLSFEPDVRFLIAGSGDMLDDLKELSEELAIAQNVTFAGFLKRNEVEKTFRSADLYVMPSVSEPFGIAPLEALSYDVPVIISKQSGVAEVLQHVLKVDFWDTEDLANKILAVLRHPSLGVTLREEGQSEVRQLSWKDAAERIVAIYEELTRPKRTPAAKKAATDSVAKKSR